MAKHIRAQKIRLHMHLHWKKCQLLCFSLIYYFSASHSDKSQQYIWITKQKHFIAICTKFKMYREWAKHSKDCCCCIKCLLKSKIMWTMCSSFGLSFSLFFVAWLCGCVFTGKCVYRCWQTGTLCWWQGAGKSFRIWSKYRSCLLLLAAVVAIIVLHFTFLHTFRISFLVNRISFMYLKAQMSATEAFGRLFELFSYSVCCIHVHMALSYVYIVYNKSQNTSKCTQNETNEK